MSFEEPSEERERKRKFVKKSLVSRICALQATHNGALPSGWQTRIRKNYDRKQRAKGSLPELGPKWQSFYSTASVCRKWEVSSLNNQPCVGARQSREVEVQPARELKSGLAHLDLRLYGSYER
jgi:hypothetical protein